MDLVKVKRRETFITLLATSTIFVYYFHALLREGGREG